MFSNISSVVVFLTGVVVLAGWLFNVTILKSFHAGLIAMKPNTAVCFILLGVSLWLSQTKRTGPRLPIRRASLRASGGPGGLGDPVGVWPCMGSWFRPVMVHRREGNVQILAARPHDSDDGMDSPFQRAWFAGFGHGRSSQHAARPNPGAFGRGLLPPGHVRLYLRHHCFSRPHGGFRRHVFAYGAGVQSALRRPPLRSKLRAH